MTRRNPVERKKRVRKLFMHVRIDYSIDVTHQDRCAIWDILHAVQRESVRAEHRPPQVLGVATRTEVRQFFKDLGVGGGRRAIEAWHNGQKEKMDKILGRSKE